MQRPLQHIADIEVPVHLTRLRGRHGVGGLFTIFVLPLLAYCAVQAGRDLKNRNWLLGIWGGLMFCFVLWMMTRLMSGPQH